MLPAGGVKCADVHQSAFLVTAAKMYFLLSFKIALYNNRCYIHTIYQDLQLWSRKWDIANLITCAKYTCLSHAPLYDKLPVLKTISVAHNNRFGARNKRSTLPDPFGSIRAVQSGSRYS